MFRFSRLRHLTPRRFIATACPIKPSNSLWSRTGSSVLGCAVAATGIIGWALYETPRSPTESETSSKRPAQIFETEEERHARTVQMYDLNFALNAGVVITGVGLSGTTGLISWFLRRSYPSFCKRAGVSSFAAVAYAFFGGTACGTAYGMWDDYTTYKERVERYAKYRNHNETYCMWVNNTACVTTTYQSDMRTVAEQALGKDLGAYQAAIPDGIAEVKMEVTDEQSGGPVWVYYDCAKEIYRVNLWNESGDRNDLQCVRVADLTHYCYACEIYISTRRVGSQEFVAFIPPPKDISRPVAAETPKANPISTAASYINAVVKVVEGTN